MTPAPSEQAAAVLNLIDRGVLAWDEPDVVKVLKGALKVDTPQKSRTAQTC